MQVLIDTHVVVWLFNEPNRLSLRASEILASIDSEIFVSAATAWEIAIKVKLGKMQFDQEFLNDFDQQAMALRWTTLQMIAAHGVAAASLPQGHKDPFDRMLCAQARLEGLELLSNDEKFKSLGLETIW